MQNQLEMHITFGFTQPSLRNHLNQNMKAGVNIAKSSEALQEAVDVTNHSIGPECYKRWTQAPTKKSSEEGQSGVRQTSTSASKHIAGKK